MRSRFAWLIPLVSIFALPSCSGSPSRITRLSQSASFNISDSYETGNYGSFNYGNVEFDYYRAVGKKEDSLATLVAFSSPYGETLGGSLYNTTSIDNIEKIVLEYSTELAEGEDKPTLYYGKNGYESSCDLAFSVGIKTFEIKTKEANYFKIESGDADLTIKSIEITRDDSKSASDNDFKKHSMGEGQYRAHPKAFEGELVAGESQAEVPIEVKMEGNRYSVLRRKAYTYYSFDYVYDHPEVSKDAAMTSPIDVANYFSIFKEFPANYITNQDKRSETAKSLFGEDVRQVSTYDRVDGYIKEIPYAVDPSTNLPLYHEFDIALDDSYASSRGVGRVVAVETGLDVESYGKDVVCYYTDDHYATFQEYGNLGEFLPRFSADYNILDMGWGEPSLAIS